MEDKDGPDKALALKGEAPPAATDVLNECSKVAGIVDSEQGCRDGRKACNADKAARPDSQKDDASIVTSTKNTTFSDRIFPFLDLPPEIRIMVYRFVFDELPKPAKDIPAHDCEPSALFQVCRLIRKEANWSFGAWIEPRERTAFSDYMSDMSTVNRLVHRIHAAVSERSFGAVLSGRWVVTSSGIICEKFAARNKSSLKPALLDMKASSKLRISSAISHRATQRRAMRTADGKWAG